jgi:hypothetical protein
MNEKILSSIDNTLKDILKELQNSSKKVEEISKKNEMESTRLEAQMQGLLTGALSQHAINNNGGN